MALTSQEKRERRQVRHELQNRAKHRLGSFKAFGRFSTVPQIKAMSRVMADRYISFRVKSDAQENVNENEMEP